MREEAPPVSAATDEYAANEARAWYAQIASISSSLMLVLILALGGIVAYVIADMRDELYVVSTRLRAEAPSLREKELAIRELREENDRLKTRLEQLQREVARGTAGQPPLSGVERGREKLSEAGNGLAGCIDAALNGKGSVGEKCAGQAAGEVVVKSHG